MFKKNVSYLIAMMISLLVVLSLAVVIASCTTPADIASQNLSTAADQFKIERRIVFYNGITGTYMLLIEGNCSLGNYDKANEVTVTCKTGDNKYVKHFLGLSDNVTFFAEQTSAVPIDTYRYKVLVRPEQILPYMELDINSNKE